MRHLCKGLALAICAALGVLTVLLVLPGLFGIRPLIVQSKSMEPAYPKGSMLYVRNQEPSGLSEGTAVTFHLADQETLVTHRIVRMDMEKGEIYTKGDANETEDSAATPFELVVGVPFFCIPCLGYLAGCLSSMPGKAAIIILVVMVYILSWIDDNENFFVFRKKSTCKKQ